MSFISRINNILSWKKPSEEYISQPLCSPPRIDWERYEIRESPFDLNEIEKQELKSKEFLWDIHHRTNQGCIDYGGWNGEYYEYVINYDIGSDVNFFMLRELIQENMSYEVVLKPRRLLNVEHYSVAIYFDNDSSRMFGNHIHIVCQNLETIDKALDVIYENFCKVRINYNGKRKILKNIVRREEDKKYFYG